METAYRLVAKIPAGKVATYGQIALLCGRPRASRIVGWAMSHAPPERKLPCHRVVNRFGELASEHVFNGSKNQRHLLETEGITFLNNGKIDLKQHLWKPDYEESLV